MLQLNTTSIGQKIQCGELSNLYHRLSHEFGHQNQPFRLHFVFTLYTRHVFHSCIVLQQFCSFCGFNNSEQGIRIAVVCVHHKFNICVTDKPFTNHFSLVYCFYFSCSTERFVTCTHTGTPFILHVFRWHYN